MDSNLESTNPGLKDSNPTNPMASLLLTIDRENEGNYLYGQVQTVPPKVLVFVVYSHERENVLVYFF